MLSITNREDLRSALANVKDPKFVNPDGDVLTERQVLNRLGFYESQLDAGSIVLELVVGWHEALSI